MIKQPNWLPPLVLLHDYGGNWEHYLDTLYEFFKSDFVDDRPSYRGVRLGLKRYPVIEGKEATFWHLISEGRTEKERVPDLRRCERIRWPRPIIEKGSGPSLKVWETKRKGEKRICFWLEKCEYLVILAERSGCLLLWTAYLVTMPHQKRRLQKEYKAYKKAGAAL